MTMSYYVESASLDSHNIALIFLVHWVHPIYVDEQKSEKNLKRQCTELPSRERKQPFRLLTHLCNLHGGLICITFCLHVVCLDLTKKSELQN